MRPPLQEEEQQQEEERGATVSLPVRGESRSAGGAGREGREAGRDGGGRPPLPYGQRSRVPALGSGEGKEATEGERGETSGKDVVGEK